MRDFLGKAMPGLGFAFSVAAAALGPGVLFKWLQGLSIIVGTLLIGLGWVVGVVLQAYGEAKYSSAKTEPPKTICDIGKGMAYICEKEKVTLDDKWYRLYAKFRQGTDQEVAEHERLVAIMESCGIVAAAARAAILLVPTAWFLRVVYDQVVSAQWTTSGWEAEAGGLIVVVVAALFLWQVSRFAQLLHEAHRERHYKLVVGFEASNQGQKPTSQSVGDSKESNEVPNSES